MDLDNWPILQTLSTKDLASLKAAARRRIFDRGQILFHEGDPGQAAHFITCGTVLVYVTRDSGESAALAVRAVGAIVGEQALLDGTTTRSASVRALERVETLSVSATSFDALRSANAGFERFLTTLLATRVGELNQRVLGLLFQPAELRVIDTLRDLAAIYDRGERPIRIPLSQEVLGNIAGTSRVTTNRALARAARTGAIVQHRSRIEVVRPDDIRS